MTRVNLKSVLRAVAMLSLGALGLGLQFPEMARAADASAPEQIIVTARRVEERLQDVPISITVFNQQQLENRNIVTGGDLATYTPSLQTQNAFGADNITYSIRGFVAASATSPSVGVYFADVVAPRAQGTLGGGNGAGPGAFFDLQNVQVLKGPQGTLFGRNTTGGAILLVPQKPTDKFEGYIEASGGNYNMEQIQGVVNVPFNDKVRVRLGIDHQSRDGYLHNVSGIGPSNFDDVDYTSLRASIVVDVTPNVENYTIATWSKSDTNGDYPKSFGYTPGNPGTDLGSNIGAQIAATSGNFWNVSNGRPDAREYIRQWSIINTTKWEATDDLTVKNIASYSQLRELHNTNIFGDPGTSPLPGPPGGIDYVVSVGATPGHDNLSESTLTEELQLQGHTSDKRLTYQTGGYFEQSLPLGVQGTIASILVNCTNPYTYQCTDLVGRAFGFEGFIGSEAITQTKYTFRDYGVYGQATYKIVDQLSLTGGIRYTSDTASGLGNVITANFPAPNTPSFSCGLPVPLVAGGTSAQIQANQNLCNYAAKVKSHAPTWLIDLDYKPIDDVMLYGKYARGYRQGSVNVSQYGLGNWAPEKVDTFEIGAKTSFNHGIRGTFNIAAFYNNFSNQQLQVSATSCTAAQLGTPQCPFIPSPAAGIANAGKSKIEGAELETSIFPVDAVRLDFAYTYLYTKLESVNLPAPPVGFTSVSFPSVVGGPLAFSPKHKFELNGSYTLPLNENLGPIAIAATFTYQSSFFNTQTAAPGFSTLGSQKNLNLNLNWTNVFGHPIDFSLFATNVTNEKYYEATNGGFSNFNYDLAFLNAPAMYGARLRYHFGG